MLKQGMREHRIELCHRERQVHRHSLPEFDIGYALGFCFAGCGGNWSALKSTPVTLPATPVRDIAVMEPGPQPQLSTLMPVEGKGEKSAVRNEAAAHHECRGGLAVAGEYRFP